MTNRLPSKTKKTTITNQAKRYNAMLQGKGADSSANRGWSQKLAPVTTNPFYDTNFWTRWRELVNWYYTDWAARKIVNIPVEDALRKPFKINGLESSISDALMKGYEALNVDNLLRRALKQERLLGGSMLYLCIADANPKQNNKTLADPLDITILKDGDFKAVNLIDIQKIVQTHNIIDCFNPEYDKPMKYTVNGVEVHKSRLVVFDGEPLFNRAVINIYQNWRVNPSGFGESVLTPIYDLMVRVTGTQEGAYHLVNMASVLLAKVDDLKSLQFGDDAAMKKIESVLNQISLYRAAMIDGSNVEITQHSASFGSVPELLYTFLTILSAACDIPATRFLGQAPGGLNATGDSDLENYYNVIDSYQRLQLKPKIIKILRLIGITKFGIDRWAAIESKMDIEFPPLWNLTESDQATINKTICDTYIGLYTDGVITAEQAFAEINARDVFMTKIEFDEAVLKAKEEEENRNLLSSEDIAKMKSDTKETKEPSKKTEIPKDNKS